MTAGVTVQTQMAASALIAAVLIIMQNKKMNKIKVRFMLSLLHHKEDAIRTLRLFLWLNARARTRPKPRYICKICKYTESHQ